jgi:hypothetical protein
MIGGSDKQSKINDVLHCPADMPALALNIKQALNRHFKGILSQDKQNDMPEHFICNNSCEDQTITDQILYRDTFTRQTWTLALNRYITDANQAL